MKTTFSALLLTIALIATGCNEGTPGGPGATKPNNTPGTSTDNTNSSASNSSTDTPSSTTSGSSGTASSDATASTSGANSDSTDGGTTTDPATGATVAKDNPAIVGTDNVDTFRLDAPNLGTTIKQGESQIVKIGISRAKNFDQDVKLEFQGVPKGVTIEPMDAMIKAGDEHINLTVKADADAALDNHEIMIVGHPESGADATNKFTITIEKP